MSSRLFSKDFTLVVIGQIISLFGNAALRFALPLYLLNLTGSSALYGTVTACAFIPSILLSPVGGVVADLLEQSDGLRVPAAAGALGYEAGLVVAASAEAPAAYGGPCDQVEGVPGFLHAPAQLVAQGSGGGGAAVELEAQEAVADGAAVVQGRGAGEAVL